MPIAVEVTLLHISSVTKETSFQSSGDVMVISNVAGLPLSLPAMRMSAGVVWSLVMP